PRPLSSTTATGTDINANKLLINCVRSVASLVPSLVIMSPFMGMFGTGAILLRRHTLGKKKNVFFLKIYALLNQHLSRAGISPRSGTSHTSVSCAYADNRRQYPDDKAQNRNAPDRPDAAAAGCE